MQGTRKTFKQIAFADGAIDFAEIAAGAVGSAALAVPGAAVNDFVQLALPSTLNTGLMATGFVSAANVVTIRLFNGTGSAIDPASSTFGAAVSRMI